MTYKIKENAKNVWIRNNENTQDLSPLTDANSVYFNSGRTLEQELGKGVMESNIVTIDSTMSKVIDEAYDGVYESCVFKGKSLVNLLNYSFPSTTDWYDNAGANSYIRTGQSISMLKPNTDYLMWFEGETTIVQTLALSTVFTKAYFELTGKSLVKVRTVNGELPANFTIHFKSSVGGSLTDNEKASVKLMLIEYIEGMEEWDIPYFEGLCDSKMPILRNVGKNLINKATNTDGRFIWTTGGEYSDTNTIRTDFIRVPSNSTLYSNYKTHFFLYDRNKQYLGVNEVGNKTSSAGSMKNTHVIGTNETYVRIYWDKTSGEDNHLTVSSTATTYEDYKTNILRTPEEIVLREVNGVQDTYNAITGEYTKRIGEKVLCGETAEDWRDFRNTFIEKTETIDVYLINPEQKGNSNLLCDKMRTTSKGTYMNDEEGISCSGGSGLNIWVSIFKNKLSTPNKEGFKQWLQSNPITVQYELAEPVTTIVKPSTITPFIYQNGHIILESGYEGQSLTPILEYTTITNRTGQVENVAKTIRQHEAQLTLLEKMLITNIIELDYNNTLMALNLKMDEVK